VSRTDRLVRLVARVLLATGLVALGYATYVVVDARRYQAVERQQFDDRQDDPRHDGIVAAAIAPVDGHAIGAIQIPRIGLSAVVAQGDSTLTLRRAVGHLADSSLPGDAGNVVLAAHRDGLFRPLKDIRAGDAITLTTSRGAFAYVVESTSIVSPTNIDALRPHGGRTLTLVTCFPFSYLGSSPERFIVRAREIESAR